MEEDVKSLDNDIKNLRSEMKEGFDKVIAKFDVMRDELSQGKAFGKGVYWVIAAVVAGVVAFKEAIITYIVK